MLARIVQNIPDSLFKGDARLPARGGVNFRRITKTNGGIGGAKLARIDTLLNLGVALAEHHIKQMLYRAGLAAAHVVDLSGLAAFDQSQIGLGHVAHIGKVAFGAHIAQRHHWLTLAHLDFCDLTGKIRSHKLGSLLGANMIKGSRNQHIIVVADVILQSHQILRAFADCIGVIGPQRVVLAKGQYLARHWPSVDLIRGDDQHAWG